MSTLISGIHHVTAIAGKAQTNYYFYTEILGLRLVKKTVNFDNTGVYHLYYADYEGTPGTVMTFFPYPGLVQGRKGNGQLTETSFSVAASALPFWIERLKQYGINTTPPQQRMDEEYISFQDPDGLGLEIVGNSSDTRMGFATDGIDDTKAIKGFYTVTLTEEGYEKTATLLSETLQFKVAGEAGNRYRFQAGDGGPGRYVDLLCQPEGMRGLKGSGTVHHLAFATPDDDSLNTLRDQVVTLGYNTTKVLDRNYFHSIYFREPGGVLFEVATVPPGFTVDESLENLGAELQLPEWEAPNRAVIEEKLEPLD